MIISEIEWPWIAVTDITPPVEVEIQAWDVYGNWYPRVEYRGGRWWDNEIDTCAHSALMHCPITHWMPRPTKPKENT